MNKKSKPELSPETILASTRRLLPPLFDCIPGIEKSHHLKLVVAEYIKIAPEKAENKTEALVRCLTNLFFRKQLGLDVSWERSLLEKEAEWSENQQRLVGLLQEAADLFDSGQVPVRHSLKVVIENHAPSPYAVFINREDFQEVAPHKKYRGLVVGGEVCLGNTCVIRCDDVIKDENGDLVELRCSYVSAVFDTNAEGHKSQCGITWTSVPPEWRDFSFMRDNPFGFSTDTLRTWATEIQNTSTREVFPIINQGLDEFQIGLRVVGRSIASKKGGGSDPDGATRAMTVREIARYIPTSIEIRSAIVARLSSDIGITVTKQYVAGRIGELPCEFDKDPASSHDMYQQLARLMDYPQGSK